MLSLNIFSNLFGGRDLTRSEAPADIQPGNRYCRRRRDNVTETATVLELRPDPFGIPHVRFTLAFEQPPPAAATSGCACLRLRASSSNTKSGAAEPLLRVMAAPPGGGVPRGPPPCFCPASWPL